MGAGGVAGGGGQAWAGGVVVGTTAARRGLKIIVSAFDEAGAKTGVEVIVPIPDGLSLRVATLHAIEQSMKSMKDALKGALKNMGLK